MEHRILERGELDGSTQPDLSPARFTDSAHERADGKPLRGARRIFAHFGYPHWVAGHPTLRDPEPSDRLSTDPLGVCCDCIRFSELIRVDFAGNVAESERPLDAAPFAIHTELHSTRDDTEPATHAHTPYGRG